MLNFFKFALIPEQATNWKTPLKVDNTKSFEYNTPVSIVNNLTVNSTNKESFVREKDSNITMENLNSRSVKYRNLNFRETYLDNLID